MSWVQGLALDKVHKCPSVTVPFFLVNEAVNILLDKSVHSTTLLVRVPLSGTVMSSFSLGHMNSP